MFGGRRGYTHHWRFGENIDPDDFACAVRDCKALAEAGGVDLAAGLRPWERPVRARLMTHRGAPGPKSYDLKGAHGDFRFSFHASEFGRRTSSGYSAAAAAVWDTVRFRAAVGAEQRASVLRRSVACDLSARYTFGEEGGEDWAAKKGEEDLARQHAVLGRRAVVAVTRGYELVVSLRFEFESEEAYRRATELLSVKEGLLGGKSGAEASRVLSEWREMSSMQYHVRSRGFNVGRPGDLFDALTSAAFEPAKTIERLKSTVDVGVANARGVRAVPPVVSYRTAALADLLKMPRQGLDLVRLKSDSITQLYDEFTLALEDYRRFMWLYSFNLLEEDCKSPEAYNRLYGELSVRRRALFSSFPAAMASYINAKSEAEVREAQVDELAFRPMNLARFIRPAYATAVTLSAQWTKLGLVPGKTEKVGHPGLHLHLVVRNPALVDHVVWTQPVKAPLRQDAIGFTTLLGVELVGGCGPWSWNANTDAWMRGQVWNFIQTKWGGEPSDLDHRSDPGPRSDHHDRRPQQEGASGAACASQRYASREPRVPRARSGASGVISPEVPRAWA